MFHENLHKKGSEPKKFKVTQFRPIFFWNTEKFYSSNIRATLRYNHRASVNMHYGTRKRKLVLNCPSYSSDLTPSDIYLFLAIKKIVIWKLLTSDEKVIKQFSCSLQIRSVDIRSILNKFLLFFNKWRYQNQLAIQCMSFLEYVF